MPPKTSVKKTEEQCTEAIKFVNAFIRKNGYSPSIREIGYAIGVSSTSTVYSIMQKCEDNGFIVMNTKIARSVRVTDLGLSVYGKLENNQKHSKK